jgi:putative hydrolase of the HAD superfamily
LTTAVLLDAFGTLLSMDAPAPRLREELARRGCEVSEERAHAAFRAEIAYYLEHHLEGRDRESLDDLRDRCAQVMSDALGNPPVDVRAAMLAAIRFTAFADAAPALRELRARGLRLVVVSNWDCSLGKVLRAAGLRDLVDAVVTSAEAGAAKPDARIFGAGLERADCEPAEAVHVGDSPAHDVAGAAAAGIRGVLIERVLAGPPSPARIASLAELPAVLFES